jgi:hypothetical protein
MLIVKVVEAAGIPGGSAVELCDEHGEPLPNQVSCRLEQAAGERSVLTVSFSIDGEKIVLK